MNTDELDSAILRAELRVLNIQAKLHRWANDDPHRRFDDLFNLVTDPGFLLVAWDRVRRNKGARTAGVDGKTARYVEQVRGVESFLAELRQDLKARLFRPLPARQRAIPKGGGKVRYLGIATIRDRVVQAALKLVLEPIWEADFLPCSYGFRPNRRTHDAVAEVHHFASCSYEWIVEGDIKACFDEISHSALLERVRKRVGDKRVLALVKAFLKAGILTEDGTLADTSAGTPQGGLCSAEHKPPNAQCWVMRSVDLSDLLRAGCRGRTLCITRCGFWSRFGRGAGPRRIGATDKLLEWNQNPAWFADLELHDRDGYAQRSALGSALHQAHWTDAAHNPALLIRGRSCRRC